MKLLQNASCMVEDDMLIKFKESENIEVNCLKQKHVQSYPFVSKGQIAVCYFYLISFEHPFPY